MKYLNAFRVAIAVSGVTIQFREVSAAAFINLGFDQLNWPDPESNPIPGAPISALPGNWLRPGWQSTPQTAVGYNYSQNYAGFASILDRDFRDTHFGSNSKVPVVGNYSLGIWPRAKQIDPGIYQPYTLTQTGDIPGDALSLRFLYHGNDLRVFVAGEIRELVGLPDVISSDPEIPLFHYYAVDVSPYAGDTVELKFEFRSQGYDDFRGIPRLPGEPNATSHVLDDLSFNPFPAVPEPSTWILALIGIGSLTWYCRRSRPE